MKTSGARSAPTSSRSSLPLSPYEKAADAHAEMERGQHIGKIMLTVK